MIIDVSDISTIPMEIEQKILERFQSMPCSIVSKIKKCEIEYDRDVLYNRRLYGTEFGILLLQRTVCAV